MQITASQCECQAGRSASLVSGHSVYVMDGYYGFLTLANKILQMSKLKMSEIDTPNHLSCFKKFKV